MMLTITANIFILISMVAASMLFMTALNRLWPREKRQAHNDLIGWQLNIIGTTYAVILGFMLYTVWTDFGAANLNVDLEASALRNVYRLAEGLPEEQRIKLQQQSRSYAVAVIAADWPQMARDQVPEESHEINQAMWKTLMSVKLATPSEIVAEDHVAVATQQELALDVRLDPDTAGFIRARWLLRPCRPQLQPLSEQC